MLVLTTSWYYLAANGKINNFPTYLAALAWIAVTGSMASILPAGIDKRMLITVVSLIVYLSISAVWSPGASAVIIGKSFANACLLLAFILGIVWTSTCYPDFLKWFLIITTLSAAVSAVYSIYLYFSLPDYHPLIEERLYALGRLRNPVIGALSYGIAAVICVNLLLVQAGPVRWLWLICLCVLLYGTLLTETRSAWIGLIIAIPVSIIAQNRLDRRKRYLALSLFLMAVLVTLVTTWLGGYWDEMLHRAASFRPEIWLRVLEDTFSANPLIGKGIAAGSKMEINGILFQHAHSIYFATFFYGGLAGLGLLLALLVSCIYPFRNRSASDLSVLALSGLAFAGSALFFDGDRLLTKVSYMWMVFWLPVSLCLLASRENGEIRLD